MAIDMIIIALTSIINLELSLKLDLRKAKGLGKGIRSNIQTDEYVKKERAQWD